MLVEAGGDGSVMLDLVEEALDEIAAFVEARAECGSLDAMSERPDVRSRALGGDPGAQHVAVIATIGQQDALARQRIEHVLGALAVVCLSPGQLERDRKAARIDEGMDLGRKPAAGTAHATTSTAFFSPLAAC